MKTTLLHVRRLAVAVALLGIVVSPRAAWAQSELDASEAAAFMGTWTVSLETDQGSFDLPLEIEDQGGKVAANVGLPPGGEIVAVTDITRSDERLVLSYDIDGGGQLIPATLTLTPDGEGLRVVFDVGGGLFSAGGSATRAGN